MGRWKKNPSENFQFQIRNHPISGRERSGRPLHLGETSHFGHYLDLRGTGAKSRTPGRAPPARSEHPLPPPRLLRVHGHAVSSTQTTRRLQIPLKNRTSTNQKTTSTRETKPLKTGTYSERHCRRVWVPGSAQSQTEPADAWETARCRGVFLHSGTRGWRWRRPGGRDLVPPREQTLF